MDDGLAERVAVLERDARRLRRWVLALAAVLVGILAVGAGGPRELTLRKLTLVDGDGNVRIQTSGGGVIEFWDAERRLRGLMGTPAGAASLTLFDPSVQQRVAIVATDGGDAYTWHYDANGKMRIRAETDVDGTARLELVDPSEVAPWSKRNRRQSRPREQDE